MKSAEWIAAAESMRGRRILAVGDWVADENLYGETARISREAPVLILEYRGRELFPGGGANATNNLLALGAIPVPVAVVGDDEIGRELIGRFADSGTETRGILTASRIETTVKTRIFGGGPHTVRQQMLRLDRGRHGPLDAEVENRILERIDAYWNSAEAVMVSDYGYGVVGHRVRDHLLKRARETHKMMVVDSRFALEAFTGVTSMTPNEPEAEALVGRRFANEADLQEAGRELLARLEIHALLITRGPQGMALFEPDRPTDWIPVFGTDEVADVTGAGDTVMATYCAALAGGAGFAQAARLANIAGGLVVLKRGTAVVTQDELQTALSRWTESANP